MVFKRTNVADKFIYKVFVVLFIISIVYFYFNIWKDYSDDIGVIAKPMRDNVLKFNQKHERYPTLDESINLLKLSGCNDVDANFQPRYEGEQRMVYICKSSLKDMSINAEISERATPYSLSFYIGYSRCHIRFDTRTIPSIDCYQYPIIDLRPNGG